MLEPIADDPRVLLEHHKRQARLSRAVGDHRSAYWHGRRIQIIRKRLYALEHEESLERGRASNVAGCRALEEYKANQAGASK